MIAIGFDKETANGFLTSLTEGGAIQHEGRWTANEMLMLAGACFGRIMSQGPALQKKARMMRAGPRLAHPDHEGANDDELFRDIHGAISFFADMTTHRHERDFDETYQSLAQMLFCGSADSEDNSPDCANEFAITGAGVRVG